MEVLVDNTPVDSLSVRVDERFYFSVSYVGDNPEFIQNIEEYGVSYYLDNYEADSTPLGCFSISISGDVEGKLIIELEGNQEGTGNIYLTFVDYDSNPEGKLIEDLVIPVTCLPPEEYKLKSVPSSVALAVNETTSVVVSFIGDDENYQMIVEDSESEDPTFDISVDPDYTDHNHVTIPITAYGVGYGELIINLYHYGDDLELIDTLRLPITITE